MWGLFELSLTEELEEGWRGQVEFKWPEGGVKDIKGSMKAEPDKLNKEQGKTNRCIIMELDHTDCFCGERTHRAQLYIALTKKTIC